MKTLRIGDFTIGHGCPLFLIAGPCVIENADMARRIAANLKQVSSKLGVPLIFKASYDKANRSSIRSFRGPGIKKGLQILAAIREEFHVPVTSDVHSAEEAKDAGGVLDIVQIPALLCRQTDLVVAAAKTGKALNIKKGQFMAPWDMRQVIDKVESVTELKVMLTERGNIFGYNNLVVDFRSLPVLRDFEVPVVFDVTHSVQLPGGRGVSSGGQREFVETLARAGVAAGCDGLFMEVHENPEKALCDGPNSVELCQLEELLNPIVAISCIVRENPLAESIKDEG